MSGTPALGPRDNALPIDEMALSPRDFCVLGSRFELMRETDWLSLERGNMRSQHLRERACGRIRIGGECHVILADSASVSASPSIAQRLSQREFEIALRIARGDTNKDIARLLGISHLTVADYVRRLCHKLSVSSRAAIAAVVALHS